MLNPQFCIDPVHQARQLKIKVGSYIWVAKIIYSYLDTQKGQTRKELFYNHLVLHQNSLAIQNYLTLKKFNLVLEIQMTRSNEFQLKRLIFFYIVISWLHNTPAILLIDSCHLAHSVRSFFRVYNWIWEYSSCFVENLEIELMTLNMHLTTTILSSREKNIMRLLAKQSNGS